MLLVALFVSVSSPVRAAGLTVVLVDHLTLDQLLSTAIGPLDAHTLRGAVVALVSPGLPHGKDPVVNLYATLSAGDTVNATSPEAGLLAQQISAFSAGSDVRIIHFGDVDPPGRESRLRALIARLRVGSTGSTAPGILLVSVAPPFDAPNSRTWDSLTPIVWLPCGGGGSDSSLQPTLTSDTTQTAGLIALRDVAPTILAAADVPIPTTMSGHPASMVELGTGRSRDDYLRGMDRLTRLSQHAVAPFGWSFGLGGGAILLLGVWCVLTDRRTAALALRYCVRVLLATPAALMAAAASPADTPALYIGEIGLIAAVFACVPRIEWTIGLSAIAIVVDGFCGSPLVSRTVVSYYWLSGIRFYGIGNEYMGFLIGLALMAPFIGRERANSNVNLTLLAFWFLAILFVLAYPAFGAKAGGAVTAMATFLPCWFALARQKNPSPLTWCTGVVCGFASVFGLAAMARHFGARTTHIQEAAAALAHGRLRYIEHVAARKAIMAVKVAAAPGAFVGIVGVALVYAIWLRSGLQPRVSGYLATRPNQSRALMSGLWGMLAAVLFNDSGTVAALLLFGVLGMSVLHGLLDELCVSSPSTLEMSGLASQSATSSNSAPIPS